jgi:hypothetical protein
MANGLRLDQEKIADFCRRSHIRRLSLFGSVLRDDFGPESDVDVLVEFEPAQQPGLLGLARMSAQLSVMIGGRPVDLRTAKDLSRHFREEVLRTAEVVFAR